MMIKINRGRGINDCERKLNQHSLNIRGVTKRRFVLAGMLLALGMGTGCAALIPTPPSDTYDITAPTSFPGLKGGSRAQILILEPSALKVLDSQNIVIKPADTIVEYLGQSQWSDRLPKVVQAKLVESFENTNRVRAVAKPGEGLVIDYQIVSDIRAFEANVSDGALDAHVSISVKLVSDRTGKVVRSKVFDESQPLSSSKPGDVVTGLDAAFDKIARKIVSWTFSRI